jgi:hypothetical protein
MLGSKVYINSGGYKDSLTSSAVETPVGKSFFRELITEKWVTPRIKIIREPKQATKIPDSVPQRHV